MPIPKPKKNENQDEFISRCMGDDIMVKDYPDEKQRAAICYQQWKDKDKKSNPDNDLELRTFEVTELRVDQGEDKKPVVKGYASVFNKLSEDLGGFVEQAAPGAFAKTIQKDDIRALFNHDPNYVLGRTKNGTLRLNEDDKGLAIEIDPPDTQWSRDLQESIRRGDITQMSFGFMAVKDEWKNEQDKIPIRTLIEVWLRDVSPVTFPAYPQTSVKVRDYLNALSESQKPDGQNAPEEGYTGRLERKRKLDIAERS
jgi:HK97 family phage prohead protease